MHKIHISQKWTYKKIYAQKMLINSDFFYNRSVTTVFPLWPACPPVDLDRHVNQMSLDSTVFFLFFFFGDKIYKLKIFKNLPLAKNRYSQNFWKPAICKNKYLQSTVFLSLQK